MEAAGPLAKRGNQIFLLVKPIKPKASRDRSAETFLVGIGPKAARAVSAAGA